MLHPPQCYGGRVDEGTKISIEYQESSIATLKVRPLDGMSQSSVLYPATLMAGKLLSYVPPH